MTPSLSIGAALAMLAVHVVHVVMEPGMQESEQESPPHSVADTIAAPIDANEVPGEPSTTRWPPQVEIDEIEAAAFLDACAESWTSAEEWKVRAGTLRRQVLVALALDPLPARPDSPAIHGPRIECDGYTVESVSFESARPGSSAIDSVVRVHGNLYRPTRPSSELAPAVICPHGHFQPHGDDPGGRFRADMQIRCATLARMGAVVLALDMVGWGEDGARPHHDAESSRLQTLNGIRAIDFLQELEGVDPDRIGVTGASGGGTQSFLLACVDDRVTCCVPVVMVSAHFFGGCPCESGRPIHDALGVRTTNAELAAVAAPRALLLISCGGDWTRNTPTVELPYAQRVYATLGAPDRVANAHLADEGHDYGPTKRAPMYRFMARHLGLDLAQVTRLDGSIDEAGITILPRADLVAPAPVPAAGAAGSSGP